jgi:hypothetical protein
MKKGLLIGINYIGTLNELNGCINDVTNLKNLLVGGGYFTSTDLCMMTDKEGPTSALYPNKQNILRQMDQLVSYANSVPSNRNIQLFVAYSGHGSSVKDTNRDETDGNDEVLCPVDFPTAGFIVDDQIRTNFINKLGANVTLVVLIDACHSGTVMDLRYMYACDGKQTCITQANLADTRCNVIMISGCRDNQTSADAYVARSYQGAMTAAFLATYSKQISTENLIMQMRNWLTQGGYDQIPQLATGHTVNVTASFASLLYNKSSSVSEIIQSASYGSETKVIDVTQIVKNYFLSGQQFMIISNSLFTDPYFGKLKELRVVLTTGVTRMYPEKWRISLDDIINDTLAQSLAKIQSAVYGKDTKVINVTAIIKKYFATIDRSILISNRLFTDPYLGVVKDLKVTLFDNQVNIFKENTTVTLTQIIRGTPP